MDLDCYDSVQLLSVSEITQEYYRLLKENYKTAFKSIKTKENFDDVLLPPDIARNIDDFARNNQISPLSQALIKLIICMEWQVDKHQPILPDSLIYNSFVHLETSLKKGSSWELVTNDEKDSNFMSMNKITDFELNVLEQVTSFYIHHILSENHNVALFFPVASQPTESVAQKTRILAKIATVNVIPQKTLYKTKLEQYLKEQIKEDVEHWLITRLQKLKGGGKNTILKDLEVLIEILDEMIAQIALAADVFGADLSLFDAAECSYFDVVVEALEEKLYPICKQSVEYIDQYHNCHKNFHVNVKLSSSISLAFYLDLQKLVNLLVGQTKKKSCGKMEQYSKWFGNVFIHLLHALKSECHLRISRAVLLDELDSSAEEKWILSSSVIVLNCLTTVINEWKQLRIDDEELQVTFLIKVTDDTVEGVRGSRDLSRKTTQTLMSYYGSQTLALLDQKPCVLTNCLYDGFQTFNLMTIITYSCIVGKVLKSIHFISFQAICDGVKIFAEALEQKTGNFGIQSKDFNFTQKVCLIANSIDHVRTYMQGLPQLMKWEETLNNLKRTESNGLMKNEILRIVEHLFKSMDLHLCDIRHKTVNMVVLHIRDSVEKYLNSWLHHNILYQSVDKFLKSLDEQMQTAHKYMKESIFQKLISDLWLSFLQYIKDGFQEGENEDYAKKIQKNLEELRKYFRAIDLEETEEAKKLQDQVFTLLALNSKSTVELQLDYYGQLADLVISPLEYLGHLAFQAGYKKVGLETLDIFIKVQKGQRFPIRKYEMIELAVTVELCPKTMFPSLHPLKSEPVQGELDNPVFNQTFQFCKLPASVLAIKGAVIQILVLNQDGTFSAEVVLNLSSVQNITSLVSIDFLPVYLMPLRRFDKQQPPFQILESRSKWDRNAKHFVSRRLNASKSRKPFPTCIPGNSSMCGLLGIN